MRFSYFYDYISLFFIIYIYLCTIIYDAIKVSTKCMNKKCSCFEYLIDCLYRRNNGVLNDFTTLKLIKLLFLVVGVSSTEQERGLTDIFDNFVAMPYGPVESDIYNAIQSNKLSKYCITSSQCKIKDGNAIINLDDNQRQTIDRAITLLFKKNPNILQCQPFELVDITHKWSCWRICYDIALANGKHSIGIPSRMIQKSVKYYQ